MSLENTEKNARVKISPEIAKALEIKQGVVALESTIVAHGLPWPENLETAFACEHAVYEARALPATIAILKGELRAGLSRAELETLAQNKKIAKASVRDIPVLIARQGDGATTVAATMTIAHLAGIQVMATGGIGGVHRGALDGKNPTLDISADLPVLAHTPMLVVCAGAKIILDLPKTREWLETHGVTVLGYETEEFPGFYIVKTGLSVDASVESPQAAAQIALERWKLGLSGSILLVNPPPVQLAFDAGFIEDQIALALRKLAKQSVQGRDVTPFLLKTIQEATEGKAVELNRALVESNAALAGAVASALARLAS
jgi:pseudouridine-5'-phosphate glycosidase